MTARIFDDQVLDVRPDPMPANVVPLQPSIVTEETAHAGQLVIASSVLPPLRRAPGRRAGKVGPFFGRWARRPMPQASDGPRRPPMADPDWHPDRQAAFHAAMRLPTEVERARALAAVFGRYRSCPHRLATLGGERAGSRPTGEPGRPLRPWRWRFGPYRHRVRIAADIRPMHARDGGVLAAELVEEFGMGLVAAELGVPIRVVRAWNEGRMSPPSHLVDRMLLWRAAADGAHRVLPGVLDCRD